MGWSDWIRTVEIEPSLYAADFADLGSQIDTLMQAGARVFHFDVGDGHFVPPVTIGPVVLASIAERIHDRGGVLDCHLMTENPQKHFAAVADAGGDSVTFHLEAVGDPRTVVSAARDLGLGVGLAFKPVTSPEDAVAAAEGVDIVLCMSIEPGYSGQEFLPDALGRIRSTRRLLPDEVHVQVDGGIGADNARDVREAGATLLVAGSAIFGRDDPAGAYRAIATTVG